MPNMQEQGQIPDEGQAPTGAGQSMGPGQEQNTAQPNEMNPIITALQDIGKFITAQQESQNPQAASMMQHFTALVQAMQGQGGAPQEQAPQEQEAPGPKGPQQMAPQGVGGQRMGGQGSMEQGGRKGAVPVL